MEAAADMVGPAVVDTPVAGVVMGGVVVAAVEGTVQAEAGIAGAAEATPAADIPAVAVVDTAVAAEAVDIRVAVDLPEVAVAEVLEGAVEGDTLVVSP